MAELTIAGLSAQYHSYNGCPDEKDVDIIGPSSSHICLISKEGHRFAMKREHILISSVLPEILPGKEGQPEYVDLGDSEYGEYASTSAVTIVCEYLVYHSYCKQLLQQGKPIPDFGEVLQTRSLEHTCQGLVLAIRLQI